MNEPPMAHRLLAPEEYLDHELVADVRHEYVAGRRFAMPASNVDHNRLVGNLLGPLVNHLQDGPCEVFSIDLKLRAHESLFYYPDLMVCCDPTDNQPLWRERPRYVIEVSSPSTEAVDEREKSFAYLQVASVEAYILVRQDRCEVTVHRRAGTGWQTETLTAPSDVLRLEGIGFTVTLERLYQRTAVAAS
jgi:Uma2 family endonuclease